MSEPQIVALTAATSAQWHEVATRCPTTTFFHTETWATLWCAYRGRGLTQHALYVRFDDGIETLLPGTRQRLLGGLVERYASSAGAEYGDWLCNTLLDPAHQQALSAVLAPYNITLRQNPFETRHAAYPVAWTSSDFTQAINLEPGFETILQHWSDTHRRSVRKAERSGLTVRVASTHRDWQDYFELYQHSKQRWGQTTQSVHSWKLFELLQALPDQTVCLWMVHHQGKPIAGAICFYHQRHAVYWHGAADASYFEHRPMHRLFHHVIQDSCARQLRWFDFGPSGGLAGVVAFKDGFGVQRLPANLLRQRSGWYGYLSRRCGKKGS